VLCGKDIARLKTFLAQKAVAKARLSRLRDDAVP